MTMKLTITNNGPAPYVTKVKRDDGFERVLQVGETAEVCVWKGSVLFISEESAPNE